jgi:hypothetical protein
MPYELAQQLKDAGFPQEAGKDFGSYYALPPANSPAPGWGKMGLSVLFTEERRAEYEKETPGVLAKVPMLETLIEACGKFFRLDQLVNSGTWLAFSKYDHAEEGSTPTEAVARLWLALNKK